MAVTRLKNYLVRAILPCMGPLTNSGGLSRYARSIKVDKFYCCMQDWVTRKKFYVEQEYFSREARHTALQRQKAEQAMLDEAELDRRREQPSVGDGHDGVEAVAAAARMSVRSSSPQ